MFTLIRHPDSRDPYFNLALEDYLCNRLPPEKNYLLLYINSPSVVLGKNQNTYEEINLPYIRKEGIPVVRRVSGGGTVFHDEGNLNIAFFTPKDKNRISSFERFNGFLLPVLNALGIPAEPNYRHDILVEGRKVSGNAQYAASQVVLSHCTMLFDAKLGGLRQALKVSGEGISSKSLKSFRSKVNNVRDYLRTDMDIFQFREHLAAQLCGSKPRVRNLRTEEQEAVMKIAEEKFKTPEWNYGRSPKFNIERKLELPNGGKLLIMIERGGLISSFRLRTGNTDADLTEYFSDTPYFNESEILKKVSALHKNISLSGFDPEEVSRKIF